MIRRQVVMPVTPERLWEALTDPEQVAGWFGGHLEWELEEGGRAWFRGDDGTERAGKVEVVRPRRHLRFRWWSVAGDEGGGAGGATRGAGGAGGGEAGGAGGGEAGGAGGATRGAGGAALDLEPGGVSEVSYLLEPVAEGTRLTIQERQLTTRDIAWPQASATSHPGTGPVAGSWTRWDERLAGAWAGLAVRAFEGARA
jgi:uncharacterized protein YndB with AHSA1/START domain